MTTSLFMGSSIDAESDGQPNAASTGDDFDALGDDDDGVTLLTNFEKVLILSLTLPLLVLVIFRVGPIGT